MSLLLSLQLKILVEEDMYKVAVDGTHLLEYEHRVGGLEEVTLVRVTGDVVLYSAGPSMIWVWVTETHAVRETWNPFKYLDGVFDAQ